MKKMSAALYPFSLSGVAEENDAGIHRHQGNKSKPSNATKKVAEFQETLNGKRRNATKPSTRF